MSSIIIAGDTSGSVTLHAPAAAGTSTLTLPTTTDTLVGKATTDTLVGKATTDTLTNKTLTSPVMNSNVGNGTSSPAGKLHEQLGV